MKRKEHRNDSSGDDGDGSGSIIVVVVCQAQDQTWTISNFTYGFQWCPVVNANIIIYYFLFMPLVRVVRCHAQVSRHLASNVSCFSAKMQTASGAKTPIDDWSGSLKAQAYTNLPSVSVHMHRAKQHAHDVRQCASRWLYSVSTDGNVCAYGSGLGSNAKHARILFLFLVRFLVSSCVPDSIA